MPYTPFHLGPAFGFGLLFRKHMHVPTFIVANVIVDVEPLLVLLRGVRYPVHGYLHTLLAAFVVGIALGFSMLFLDSRLHPLYKRFLLKLDEPTSLKSFFVAGFSGVTLHVLLDSLLHNDVHPFFPLGRNPLYSPALLSEVQNFCVWIGIIGMVLYIGLHALSISKITK